MKLPFLEIRLESKENDCRIMSVRILLESNASLPVPDLLLAFDQQPLLRRVPKVIKST